MDEQSEIERETRMIESGNYEKPDLSFLEHWFAHDKDALAQVQPFLAKDNVDQASGSRSEGSEPDAETLPQVAAG